MHAVESCWPLPGIPAEVPRTPDHPGSFGAVRAYDIHTGVDLYAPEGQEVVAIEDGVVVAIDAEFTGGPDTPNGANGEPIWHTTAALFIEGVSGVILYGEIAISSWIFPGAAVYAGQVIGTVRRVLKEKANGGRYQNPANSPSMLHLELYEHGTTKAVWWNLKDEKPLELRDPTELLLSTI